MNLKYDPRAAQMLAAMSDPDEQNYYFSGADKDVQVMAFVRANPDLFKQPAAPSAPEPAPVRPRLDLETQDAIGAAFHDVRETLVNLHGMRPDQAAILVGRSSHNIVGGWNAGRTTEQIATAIVPQVRKVKAGCW